MQTISRLPYVWDYDLDEAQFIEILEGRRTFGRLDQDWAARRLLEYAPYEEIIRLIGFPKFDVFYPFQDRVLEAFDRVDTGFYLTGGTADSRGYLRHRFSDDLDFFVNDDNRFGLFSNGARSTKLVQAQRLLSKDTEESPPRPHSHCENAPAASKVCYASCKSSSPGKPLPYPTGGWAGS